MDEYEKTRRQVLLENDVESLKRHRGECDADMEAHGKLHFQAEGRMSAIEKDLTRLSGVCDKDRERFDLAIRTLQDFRLRIVSTWMATVSIGVGIGSLLGFVINLIWKKV